jgi:hypothetical protein
MMLGAINTLFGTVYDVPVDEFVLIYQLQKLSLSTCSQVSELKL